MAYAPSYPRYSDQRAWQEFEDRRPNAGFGRRPSLVGRAQNDSLLYGASDSNDSLLYGATGHGFHEPPHLQRHAHKRVSFGEQPGLPHEREWTRSPTSQDALRMLRQSLNESVHTEYRAPHAPGGGAALSLSALHLPPASPRGSIAPPAPHAPPRSPFHLPLALAPYGPPQPFPLAPPAPAFEAGHPGPGFAASAVDMGYPLSDYFIATSHNTYLSGESQLAGSASEEAYAAAIRAGCRCVELDCWEGEGGEPVVSHGHTLVRAVPFRRVLDIIAACAFERTPFPLVVDIENHCGLAGREAMARHVREALGRLLAPPLPPEAYPGPLPSPDALRGRVVLMMDAPSEREESALDGLVMLWKERKAQEPGGPDGVHADIVWNASEGEAEALLTGAPSFFGIACSCTPSGPEGPAGPAASPLARANKAALTRVFPNSSRVHSRNYNPWMFWAAGCSLVALNWQSSGAGTELQEALFALNARHGFVLKPAHLRAYAVPPPPSMLPPLAFRPPPPLPAPLEGDPSTVGPERVGVEVTVVGAKQLVRPQAAAGPGAEAADLYCAVQLYTLDDASRAKRPCVAIQRTPTAPNSEKVPVWNHTLTFEAAQPNYAVVRFVLMDEDTVSADDFVCSAAVPLTALGPEPRETGPDGKRYTRLPMYEHRAFNAGRPVYELAIAVRCFDAPHAPIRRQIAVGF